MPYLTPDAINPLEITRLITVSVDSTLLGALDDAICELSDPNTWKNYGVLTVDQVADYFLSVCLDYLGSSLIGTILPYATSIVPSFALPCDGATYNKATNPEYARLYAVLDAAFIIDGDQFIVPDLRDRTLVGVSATKTINSEGGEEEHTLTVEEIPAHAHSYNEPASIVVNGGLEAPAESAVPFPSVTGSTGGNLPHNNMPPWRALPQCIVFR